MYAAGVIVGMTYDLVQNSVTRSSLFCWGIPDSPSFWPPSHRDIIQDFELDHGSSLQEITLWIFFVLKPSTFVS
jgi:hypothetical protein